MNEQGHGSDEELDRELRGRLRHLAETEHEPLAAGAVDRVVGRLRAGQARQRGGKRWQLAAGLSVAAAIALAWFRWTAPDATPRADQRATTAATAACALAEPLTTAKFALQDDGSQRLHVGRHMVALAEPGVHVGLRSVAPCRVELHLDRGRLDVHAKALAGGELWVRTDLGDVIVRGTVFSVERHPTGLLVELAKGRVRVVRGDELIAELAPNERLLVTHGGTERSALPSEHGLALRQRLGLDLARHPPTPTTPGDATAVPAAKSQRPETSSREHRPSEEHDSAEALLARADTARRQGKLDLARRRYQQAGKLQGIAAEAAWLRLARLELQAGKLAAAAGAAAQHARAFPHGSLGAEAGWIRVQVAERRGDRAAFRRAVDGLVKQHPRSPQAKAAGRLAASQKNGDHR